MHSCEHTPAYTARIGTDDSARVFMLLDKAYEVQHADPDSAFRYILEAGDIARAYDFAKGTVNYYNQAMFNRALYKADFESARKYADSAIQMVQSGKQAEHRMLAYYTKAVYHQLKEEQDSSVTCYLQALEHFKAGSDSARLPPLYNNLAILLHYQARYRQAIAYQQKALELAIRQGDTGQIISNHNNLYRHYLAMRDTSLAASAMRNALNISGLRARWRQENETARIAGDYHLITESPDSALYYYQQHLEHTKLLYTDLHTAQPHISLARAWLAKADFAKAEYHFSEATRLLPPEELPLLARQDYYNVGYRLAKQRGDNHLALEALEAYNQVKDALAEKQQNDRLANYDRELKELNNQRASLAQELALKRKNVYVIILAAACVLLLITGIVGSLYRIRKKKLESEKMKLEAEWRELNSRLTAQTEERNRISKELHDELGATLTSVSLAASLLQDHQASNEIAIIARASSEMATRMNEIVWSLNANNDNVQSLVAYIRKFCSGFLREAGLTLTFTTTIADPMLELKGAIRRNVYQTVKEAVNNIVKHANAREVTIHIVSNKTSFSIEITDNGKGFPEKEIPPLSNGLRNMRSNMEAINGTIQWEQTNGTKVILRAPLQPSSV